MAKKTNLAAALNEVTPAPAQPVPPPAKEPPPPRVDRGGMALVGAHLPARYSKAIKILSAETGKMQRELFAEALDMLFVRYSARVDP